ncbi:PREDICTED: ankyrin repeat domain-containing protein 26-like, partial [Galeopterus variegatus]|uniref:Ankyrin repeat domain-containing protein 26-like n=1 Tax=Galeopterus variegatus TaxID=482537 RepID=A0ABM0Q2U2_GALVR
NPDLHMMEGKKNEDEKWTSKFSVIAPTLDQADSLTGGPLQVNGDNDLGRIDQDDGRFALKQEKEKTTDADMLCDELTEPLQRTEEWPSADATVRQRLEMTLRTRDAELRPARDNWNQVYDSHKKDLLHKNHTLQDEIPMLRLELDTIKSQYREKEKKYCKDIEIVEEKNEDLQKTVKWERETSTITMFQCSGQLSVLTAENTMLNSKLEDENQNKERLETEVEPCNSRRVAAIQDHDQRQASERDLDLAFQRVRRKWLYLQEQVNFDMSVIEDQTEFLSQKLYEAENNNNSLEIELCHTRDALREVTLVLGCVQRDLSQTKCQMKEIEHLYQNKQGKVNKRIGEQESVEERLSQLQHENSFLPQQLDDAHNKADHEAEIVVQCQCCDTVRTLQVQSKKPSLVLEDGNKELINECNHLKGKLHQHGDENVEREVSMKRETYFSNFLKVNPKSYLIMAKC